MKLVQIAVILLALLSLSYAQKLTKIINNLHSEARCLDGSPPAMYFYEGSTPENIVIYPMSMGACVAVGANVNESLDDCVRRSKTWEGSSEYPIPQ